MTWRYVKAPNPQTARAAGQVSARVSTMLLEIEHGGLEAVRRWSRELDDWDPDDFVVTA